MGHNIHMFFFLLQGENGVNKVLEMIRSEFSTTMALAGKSRIKTVLVSLNNEFKRTNHVQPYETLQFSRLNEPNVNLIPI